MNLKNHGYVVFLIILLTNVSSYSQTADSLNTAFRKGRWFTGLSGTISSNTTEVKSADFRTTANNYGLNIETGKFIRNRLLVGGLIQANKIENSGNVDRSAETFYIGPFGTYYFMDEKIGSLYAKVSLGYARYKDETNIMLEEDLIQSFSEGDGFGSILGLGYAYTINDFIAFDLGINLNLFWTTIEQESLPGEMVTTSKFSSSDIGLSFGFNVILDSFFF